MNLDNYYLLITILLSGFISFAFFGWLINKTKKIKIKKVKDNNLYEKVLTSIVGWSKRKVDDENILLEYHSGESLFSFGIKKDYFQFYLYNPKIEDFFNSNPVRISFMNQDCEPTKPCEYNAHPISNGWTWFVPFKGSNENLLNSKNALLNLRMLQKMWEYDSMIISCPMKSVEANQLSTKAISEPMFIVVHLNNYLAENKKLKNIIKSPLK